MPVFPSQDPDTPNKMRGMLGPGQIDHQIRQAIQMCWMMLPEDRKTVDELETQIRRIFDRAIQDLREDCDAFGIDK